MPRYRIHRIKEAAGESFRWASHTGGEVVVKLKDYEPSLTIDAATPYAAWKSLVDQHEALRPGDVLEILEGESAENVAHPSPLLITKYIGFDPAKWFVPELKSAVARPELPTLPSEVPRSTLL